EQSLENFRLAFAIFCEAVSLSRSDYQKLRECLSMVTDIEQIHSIPYELETLQTQLNKQIPTPAIYSKTIPVKPDKQSIRASGSLQKETKMFFMDPTDFIKSILLNKQRDRSHFGMAQLVDEPTELWHGGAWAESVRTCSGQAARYSAEPLPIIPSDFVVYGTSLATSKMGRVLRIYKDMRALSPTRDDFVVVLQECIPANHELMQGVLLDPPPLHNEMFLVDREEHSEIIISHKFVHLHNYRTDYANYRFIIRRIVTVSENKPKTIRSCRLAHPVLAELEIEQYGRDFLVSLSNPSNRQVISVPQMIFIDGFGLYRNVHCSLMGIYAVYSCQRSRDRNVLNNIYPITLGPHGANLSIVLDVIGTFIRRLEKGVDMFLDNPNTPFTIISPTLGFLGDTPQQADNMGCLRHNGTFGCRVCFINKAQYHNLGFDVELHGRYHYEMKNLRAIASTLSGTAKHNFLKGKGLSDDVDQPPVHLLAPALDSIRSAPTDPPHAEVQGIGRMMQTLLIVYILEKPMQLPYSEALCGIVHPPGWPKIQSAIRHRLQWDLSEQSRAVLLTAVVLRVWLTDDKLRLDFAHTIVNAKKEKLRDFRAAHQGTKFGASELVMQIFHEMAVCYGLATSPTLSTDDSKRLRQLIVECRKTFTDLVDIIVKAKSSKKNKGRQNSRAGSIAGRSRASSTASRISATSAHQRVLKAKQLSMWANRSNVHIGLHYEMFRKHYATLFNLFVLPFEAKHREFKGMVQHTNTKNTLLQLLQKEMRKKGLGFLFQSVPGRYDSRLYQQLQDLSVTCPRLLKSLLQSGSDFEKASGEETD
ncbi:hypothetical protein EDC01DRAFT_604245, partial [Geopyxis carbonaria]